MLQVGTTRTIIARTFREPTPPMGSVVLSGNSGTDPILYNGGARYMVSQVFGVVGPPIKLSTIPGSSWQYRWDNSTGYPDAKTDIAEFDVLQITGSSDIFNAGAVIAPDLARAQMWAAHAWTNGRGGLGAETLFWATWARRDGSPEADYQARFAAWPEVMDYCNARMPFGQLPTRIIPGAWVWHRFMQDTAAGLAPTPTWYDDLFLPDDPFHQNDLGRYICAALNASCIYGIDPAILPGSIPTSSPAPTPDELAYIRAVIKDVVSSFPRAGVDTSGWS